MALPARHVEDPNCQLNWEYVDTSLQGAAVTSLPTTGVAVGSTVVFAADPTHGVYWQFFYTGVGTYKWAFIGGSPMRDIVQGSGSCIAANGFTSALNDFADAGVTCPLAGVYNAVTNVGLSFTNAALNYCEAGPQLLTVGGAAADMGSMQSPAAGGGGGITKHRELTVAAGNIIATYYHTTDAVLGTFQRRKLEVIPVMVG